MEEAAKRRRAAADAWPVARIIVLGDLAERALIRGVRPRPIDLFKHLDTVQFGTTELEITKACESLERGTAALNAAAPHLTAALSASDALAIPVVSRVVELSAAAEIIEELATGDAGDVRTLLEALSDGLVVLGYPVEKRLVVCKRKRKGCRRIVPYGWRYCGVCDDTGRSQKLLSRPRGRRM
jgi:hypothetical protein